LARRGCHGCAEEARVAGASLVSSVALAGRMLGVGLRGWYWLLRGRVDKCLVAVQDLLALRPPEKSASLIELRAVLLGDLSEAGLMRLWQRVAKDPGAAAVWSEVADDLVQRGMDRERVEALLNRARGRAR